MLPKILYLLPLTSLVFRNPPTVEPCHFPASCPDPSTVGPWFYPLSVHTVRLSFHPIAWSTPLRSYVAIGDGWCKSDDPWIQEPMFPLFDTFRKWKCSHVVVGHSTRKIFPQGSFTNPACHDTWWVSDISVGGTDLQSPALSIHLWVAGSL